MRFDMFESGASDTPPSAPENPSYGYPSNGNPDTGEQPTVPGAYFFYALAEELKNMVLAAGVEPDASKTNQVAESLQKFQLFADDYLNRSGGTMTGTIVCNKNPLIAGYSDSSTLQMCGGSSTTSSSGANVSVYGASASSNAGCFIVQAGDSTGYKQLLGKPDGTLTWNSKNISCIEASGDDYIRFVDGTQVCWGFVEINSSSQTTITYPVQFLEGSGTDFKYGISCAVNNRSNYYLTPNVKGKTATAMTSNSAGQNMWWIAYGKWK